jgi:hypothetical protein
MDLREIFDNRFNRERREGRGNDSKKKKKGKPRLCMHFLALPLHLSHDAKNLPAS